MERCHIVLLATPFAALLQHDILDRNGSYNRTRIRQPQPHAMNGFLTITCPHCGEDFKTAFDPSEGGAQFVVDCEICCRPISVTVRVRSGQIDDVQVAAS
jgi:ribosomal protein S27E